MGNGSGNSNSLGSGGNPTKLQGTERFSMSQASSLPAKASESQVKSAAKSAGIIEGQVPLMKELSYYRLEQQKAALELLDIRVNHHDQSMKNEQAFQKKMSRHGKNVAAHNMISGATQKNYNGYQQNYNAARESITF
jgi:hypothetical protein